MVEKDKRTALAFPNEPSRRGSILPEGTADVMDGIEGVEGWDAKMTA